MSSRHVSNTSFKTCLQRNKFSSSKKSLRRLQDVLEDEKLLRWRCFEDQQMFAGAVKISMSSKILDSQLALGTWLSEVLISKKFLKNIYGQRKTKWKQKKRINSKLLQNAVNWHLCYIICIYSEIKLIKVLSDTFLWGKYRDRGLIPDPGFEVSFIARNTALILRIKPYACAWNESRDYILRNYT